MDADGEGEAPEPRVVMEQEVAAKGIDIIEESIAEVEREFGILQ